MRFKSQPIKGRGRGKRIGVPTINLEIPDNFPLEEGIYAAIVWMNEKEFMGALHFGPIPVFNEVAQSLEINLLDVSDQNLLVPNEVSVEVKQKIRDIRNFDNTQDLVRQIENDIKKIRQILSS